ncbi:MAG: hypothetical protein IKC70_05315 [Bacteroidaceae bacterium]|nr:hypothetical protein [Bacteroidaceae bacterium]
MKNIILIISMLAIIVGCDNGRISIKEGKLYFCNEKVGEFTPCTQTGVRFEDAVERIDDNILKVTRTFTAEENIDSVRLTFDFCHAYKCQQVIIPSVCYNGNHWGRGKEPKGFKTNDVWHTYSYRRTPIPGATYSEGEKFAVAVWSKKPANEAEAFSCSIMPDSTSVTHSLIIPEEERPFTYVDKNKYGSEYTKKMSMNKGDKRDIQAYIFVADKGTRKSPLTLFLDKAWAFAEKDYPNIITTDKVWEYGVKYAKEHLWAEEDDYKGFSIGLVPDGEAGWKQRPFIKYEIGWCGQNASFINTLLVDYLKTGNEESRDKALAALDTWTAPQTQYENGFYVAHYDNILDKRQNIVSDACNLGTAAYNFFETAELLEKSNLPERIARVKEIALGICNFVKADQQPSGVYGKGWNNAGECLYRDGTVGAFMIPPMLVAYKITGNNDYLQSAQKAYEYYYTEFSKNGYTTAGALDTWCIDKESSMPLLRASLNLFDITGDSVYIENAVQTSYYLSTWLWHYKADYGNDTDMMRYDYNTFGATSVSVQHHHLDVYALFWVGEWLKLAELTGNSAWREKALAIWANGCQLISDGTLEIKGRVRPTGGQNEAFFNCRWGFGGAPGKSRINDWLVAWPGAFRLEVLRKLADWSVLDAANTMNNK